MGEINQLGSLLVIEDQTLTQEILNNDGIEILTCLLNGINTIEGIANKLGIPAFKVKLFIDRMLKNKLIQIRSSSIINGKVCTEYEPTDEHVLGESSFQLDELKHHFIKNTSKIMDYAVENVDTFNAQMTMIQGTKEDIMNFIQEIKKIHEKYLQVEKNDSNEVYTFMTLLGRSELYGK